MCPPSFPLPLFSPDILLGALFLSNAKCTLFLSIWVADQIASSAAKKSKWHRTQNFQCEIISLSCVNQPLRWHKLQTFSNLTSDTDQRLTSRSGHFFRRKHLHRFYTNSTGSSVDAKVDLGLRSKKQKAVPVENRNQDSQSNTHYKTRWSCVLLYSLTGSANQVIPKILWNSNVQYTINPPLVLYLNQMNPHRTLPTYLRWYFNIIIPFTPPFSKCSVSVSFSYQ